MDLFDDCCSPPVAGVADLPGQVEMLRRYLFVLGARADRLDDLVQEVFAVALKKELQDRGPGRSHFAATGRARGCCFLSWHRTQMFMTDDRVELESKFAMLERTVEALSGEMHEQGRLIQALTDHVKTLSETVSHGKSGDDVEPHNTKPPHYSG